MPTLSDIFIAFCALYTLKHGIIPLLRLLKENGKELRRLINDL